jgi:hypothetical protein
LGGCLASGGGGGVTCCDAQSRCSGVHFFFFFLILSAALLPGLFQKKRKFSSVINLHACSHSSSYLNQVMIAVKKEFLEVGKMYFWVGCDTRI